MELNLKAGKLVRATAGSAGYDIYYPVDLPTITLHVGERRAIRTGISTSFEAGYVAILKEKSGLAMKGIEVKAGVIDADYPDEWLVLLKNNGDMPFDITPNMKIAQCIFVKYEAPVALISGNKSRIGGFGSTGK